MKVKRLTWSGVSIEVAGKTLLIDPLDSDDIRRFNGKLFENGSFVSAGKPKSIDLALITHLHSDHFSTSTLSRLLKDGARVYCPKEVEDKVREKGFEAHGLTPYERVENNGFVVHGLPAVDGLGSAQISWLVEGNGRKVLHAGDSLWHGFWWRFGTDYPGTDIAFLPINAARYLSKDLQPPSDQPITMDPVQAIAAAKIMKVKKVCPMHYGLYHTPGIYEEQQNVIQELTEMALREGQSLYVAQPGDLIPFK